MSFDWVQLSLLGDGGSTAHPRGRRYRDSVTFLGNNLEEDPSVRAGHPRALTGFCVQQAHLLEYFPQNTVSSEARGGTGSSSLGVFLWHLALTPPHPLTLPPPSF